MGKFPAISRLLDWVENLAVTVWQVLKIAGRWIRLKVGQLWTWLSLRLPFIQALTRRHLNNPATIIEDIALAVLGLYLIFGVLGYIFIYQAKSENRFTENLSILYPLPAAKVNGSFIWGHQYLERLRFLTTFNQQAPKSVTTRPPTDAELRQQLMDQLIQEKIIYAEAKKMNVNVSPEELKDAYDEQKGKTEDFEQKIKQLYGMTPQQFQGILAIQLLKAKMESVQIVRIRVLHILTTTPQAAQQAEAAVRSGQSFSEVAKQFSQDTQTKDKGGDLGFWTKGQLAEQISPNFEEVAFGLNPGQISGAIQSKFGYHVVQVNERTGKNYETFKDWYAKIQKGYEVKTYIPV